LLFIVDCCDVVVEIGRIEKITCKLQQYVLAEISSVGIAIGHARKLFAVFSSSFCKLYKAVTDSSINFGGAYTRLHGETSVDHCQCQMVASGCERL